MCINKNEEMLPLYEKLRDEYNDGIYHFIDGMPIWIKGAYAGKRRGRVDTPKSGYTRYQIGMNRNGKKYQILVHRLIYFIENGSLPDGVIDHKNNDPKDNRIENLRHCTSQDNLRNQPSQKNSISKFKGVAKNSGSGRPWKIAVTMDGKYIHGGYFDDEIKAALAYDQLARKHYGEYAWLNFPDLLGVV